jgi:hypothetical protein
MNLAVAVFRLGLRAPFQWIFRAWVPRSKKATPGPLLDLQSELTSAKIGVKKATMGFSGHAHESLSKVVRAAEGDVTVFQLFHPPRPHHSTSTFVLTESLYPPCYSRGNTPHYYWPSCHRYC